MRIHLTSVLADDQQKARRFDTEILGFREKHNLPLGEHAWITVVSEDAPDGTELLLEPAEHPAVEPFREAMLADGIPSASFAVDDIAAEHDSASPSRCSPRRCFSAPAPRMPKAPQPPSKP